MSCAVTWLPAQPYATGDDLPCEAPGGLDLDSDLFQWALMAASRRVFDLTGGMFPGCMESKIRPCRRVCRTQADYLTRLDQLRRPSWPPAFPYVVDGGPIPVLANCWACQCDRDPCTCGSRDRIVLPYRPVRAVTEVKIDGEVFTDWSLVGSKLYRTDDLPWPTCNNVDLADTEPGTWSIVEQHGIGLPPEGPGYVAMFAVELAKRACKQPCDLPDGVRVVSRPGVEYDLGVLDYQHRRDLLTGFVPLDDWLSALLGGPKRARERPRLWTANRSRRRPTHVLESRTAVGTATQVNGVLTERLRLRFNEDFSKTVSYPDRIILSGVLTVDDADGNTVLDLVADVEDNVAVFHLDAADLELLWTVGLDAADGEWDMLVNVQGIGWDAVAGGPVTFIEGVSEVP